MMPTMITYVISACSYLLTPKVPRRGRSIALLPLSESITCPHKFPNTKRILVSEYNLSTRLRAGKDVLKPATSPAQGS